MNHQKNTNIVIKVVLALLLFGCLLKMPYAYYQLMKWGVFLGSAYLAYSYRNILSIMYIAIAILFMPFYKFAIKKHDWQIIDVIVALILLLSIMLDVRKKPPL